MKTTVLLVSMVILNAALVVISLQTPVNTMTAKVSPLGNSIELTPVIPAIQECYAAGGELLPVYDAKHPDNAFALDCLK